MGKPAEQLTPAKNSDKTDNIQRKAIMLIKVLRDVILAGRIFKASPAGQEVEAKIAKKLIDLEHAVEHDDDPEPTKEPTSAPPAK